jgi:large subunit ribosomal protein L15
MKLNNLDKLIDRSKKRPGRGTGSGKGKTGGRGMKGQKARGKIPAAFIGGSLPLYKKLPFLRGWGNMKSKPKSVVVSLNELNRFKPNSEVTVTSFVEAKLITESDSKSRGIKVLDRGELTVKGLSIKVPVSTKAKVKIESAGGKVV